MPEPTLDDTSTIAAIEATAQAGALIVRRCSREGQIRVLVALAKLLDIGAEVSERINE